MGGGYTNSNGTGNATSSHCERPEGDKAFDRISWVIAISLAILAAISNNLGVNLQKLAWTKKQANAPVFRYRFLWSLGMMGIILASVFDFVALAFGPQSVIAPLGSLTIVMNGCVAPVMHGEKVRRKIIWTSLIIVSGCAMAVATASHENIICDIAGIFGYFASYSFLAYALVIGFLSVSVGLFCRHAEGLASQSGEDSKEYLRIFKYHRISYAFLAGLFGAQSVVFARAVGQLVMSTTRGGEMFLARWETWLILLALVAMIVIQMIYLNKGLERFESSYNVPVFTGTFIVGTAVSGGIVYGEFNAFSQLQSVLFPLGVCLCVFGVFALAWGNDEEPAEVENDVVGEMPEKPSETADRNSVTIVTPRSSLRLHSGGFTPFIIGLGDEHHHHHTHAKGGPSPSNHHHHHHHHGRDLLTGLRPEDMSPRGSGGFFATGYIASEASQETSRTSKTGGGRSSDLEVGRSTKNSSLLGVNRSGLGGAGGREKRSSAPVSASAAMVSLAPSNPKMEDDDDLLRPLTPRNDAALPKKGF